MTAQAHKTDLVSLNTPENVPLSFELASHGSRVMAFLLDSVIVIGTISLLIALLMAAIGPVDTSRGDDLVLSDGDMVLLALIQLAFFGLTNFYFIFCESRWQGRTFGKRALGLRVIARDGGPLTAGLIFARNLTRNLEVLLPAAALFEPRMLGIDSTWALILCWGWLGIMAMMPLFNRLRARVGDLVAGTLVVHAPKQALLPDLADAADDAIVDAADQYVFTQRQLDLYGIRELQILEDVLRRYPAQVDLELLDTITKKIIKKIGWVPAKTAPRRVEPYPFLRAFYAAQRGRLEHKLLFGRRQEKKIE